MSSTPRVPIFMRGVAPCDPRSAASQAGAHTRPVSWAPASREPALPVPMQPLTPPEPEPVVPPPPAPQAHLAAAAPHPASAFVALAPSSHASQEVSARLEAAIATLRNQGERLAEQARSDALEIGMLVARKILEREISTNVDALFSMIKSAIRRAGESRTLVVRLAAIDHARVHESAESAFTLGKVELVSDETLEPGDVVVETDLSTVDGRIGTRLEELRRDLQVSMKEE